MNLVHFDKSNHPLYSPNEIDWVYVYQVVEGTKLFVPFKQHPKTIIQIEHHPDGFTVFHDEDGDLFRFNTYSKVPWYNVMDVDCPPGIKDGYFISMNHVALIV